MEADPATTTGIFSRAPPLAHAEPGVLLALDAARQIDEVLRSAGDNSGFAARRVSIARMHVPQHRLFLLLLLLNGQKFQSGCYP